MIGVSKFSKVSLFSGLNNLNDISLNERYADICGYTQEEMEQQFREYLADGQVDLIKLRRWYNGYNFLGKESQKVYNPFDILLFFDNRYIYRSYWFETGTPSFLIKLIQSEHYFVPEMEPFSISYAMVTNVDTDDIPITPLLLQTGYLTFIDAKQIDDDYEYVLGYPNHEVKVSLNSVLAQIGSTIEDKERTVHSLKQIFTNLFIGFKF